MFEFTLARVRMVSLVWRPGAVVVVIGRHRVKFCARSVLSVVKLLEGAAQTVPANSQPSREVISGVGGQSKQWIVRKLQPGHRSGRC